MRSEGGRKIKKTKEGDWLEKGRWEQTKEGRNEKRKNERMKERKQ